MKKHNYKKLNAFRKINKGIFFCSFIFLFFAILIFFQQHTQKTFAQSAGEQCGGPGNNGSCVSIGSCKSPDTTNGPGGVCGSSLECCTKGSGGGGGNNNNNNNNNGNNGGAGGASGAELCGDPNFHGSCVAVGSCKSPNTTNGPGGVCGALECCTPPRTTQNGGATAPACTKNGNSYTACVVAGQFCATNYKIPTTNLATVQPQSGAGCAPYLCNDLGYSGQCVKPSPAPAPATIAKPGVTTPVAGQNPAVAPVVPAKGGVAAGAAGSTCVDGNVTGQCAVPLGGGVGLGSGDCTNIGTSVANNACLSGFCCLKLGASCQSQGGSCVTQNTACAGVGSGGNPTCTNLCPAGVPDLGRADCNLSSNPTNSECCKNTLQNGAAGLGHTTAVGIHAHLEGIGSGVNTDSTPENKSPQDSALPATVTVLPVLQKQSSMQLTARDSLNYNPQTGSFENDHFSMAGLGIIPSANSYKAILHINKYLDTFMQPDSKGLLSLTPGETLNLQAVSMIPGDIAPVGGDNIVDIQDYNKLVGCMGQVIAAICSDPKQVDLNEDGVVDQKDLNLLQSHFGAIGAVFTTPEFVCTSDPNCKTGSSTIQLCPLLCKIQNVPTK